MIRFGIRLVLESLANRGLLAGMKGQNMPIVIRAQVPGMTVEQYEGMSLRMLEQIKKMKGFVAHAGIPIPGGFEVVEFWESQEAFDGWIKNHVIPAASAAGMPPMILQVYPAQRLQMR